MNLEDIAGGQTLIRVVPNQFVTVSVGTLMGEDSLELIYRDPTGHVGEYLLTRPDEPLIAIAHRPGSFEADAVCFELACEAKRVDLALLLDPMMAVHTASVDPLPNQITAEFPHGAPEHVRRAASENGRTLGLQVSEWE